jgi:hypothetical protein
LSRRGDAILEGPDYVEVAATMTACWQDAAQRRKLKSV